MPELRKDPTGNTWVILSPERKLRPQYINRQDTGQNTGKPARADGNRSKEDCPFCPGNESMTPPEVFSLRQHPLETNQPGWQLRVVPNKYPALRVEGNLDRKGEGFYDKMNGIGAHEVVIETPEHDTGLEQMENDAAAEVFLTFKRRIADLKGDVRFRYIKIFKNHGAMAGATIPHPHSQIIAMPVVPPRVKEKTCCARQHFDTKERCIFCDIIHHEEESGKRVLLDNGDFIAAAPYAPRFPFELVLYPKHHEASFENTADHLMPPLAAIVRATIERLNNALEHPDYNIVLYNAPFDLGEKGARFFHWHMEIIPIITGTGGFEKGTDTYINAVSPEESIEVLK